MDFVLHCSELFTNCLDMLGSLLHSLPTDFHICLATGGEDGKKVYTACIKKLKSELSSAKSACLSEIQQLFPLTQKSYTVITVKQPPSTQKGHSAGERIKVIDCSDVIHVLPYRIAGYFRGVLIFVIFVGHLLVTKISTHENNPVGC